MSVVFSLSCMLHIYTTALVQDYCRCCCIQIPYEHRAYWYTNILGILYKSYISCPPHFPDGKRQSLRIINEKIGKKWCRQIDRGYTPCFFMAAFRKNRTHTSLSKVDRDKGIPHIYQVYIVSYRIVYITLYIILYGGNIFLRSVSSGRNSKNMTIWVSQYF